MSLSPEEVAQIAHLARLQLTPEEVTLFSEQLSAVLDHAARLDQVVTGSIAEQASDPELTLTVREDQPQAGLSAESALYNAKRTEARQFKVPPVLEQ